MFDAKEDLPRAQALADILCGAARSDDELDPDEAEAIRVELKNLLHLDLLPPELERHVRTFSPGRFDLATALTRLHLSDLGHKKALMRSVRTILKADGIMRETEREFFARLGQTLRIAPSDLD